jgi:hypothetical protein
MSLKQIIKRKKIEKKLGIGPRIAEDLVLPGEPMIYSPKYPIAKRTRGVQFYRNLQWSSLLKCWFQSCYNTKTPVIIIVRFYVSPPSDLKISEKALKSERVPATKSHEICDYILSFQEMLMHVLFNSYRQVVRLDAEKYYSKNPRTVCQFMKWDTYVELQNMHTVPATTKSQRTLRTKGGIQSGGQRNEGYPGVCLDTIQGGETERPSTSDMPLSDSSSCIVQSSTPGEHEHLASLYEARCRQSREIFE